MAKRGRKPIPLALRIARGLESGSNLLEPIAPPGDPIAPETLDDLAREEWERVLPMLKKLGVVSEVDGAALALYCRAYSRWSQAIREVDMNGMLCPSSTTENPYLRIAERAEDAMRRILLEFGLTPVSRQRVKPVAVKKDDLEAFLDRAETLKKKGRSG